MIESSEEEEPQDFEIELQKMEDAKASIELMKKYYDSRVNRYRVCILDDAKADIEKCWSHFHECMKNCEADEEYAMIHLNALLHLLHDPLYMLPILSGENQNYMKWYLDSAYEFAKSFVLGRLTLATARIEYERTFERFVAINNTIDYHWSEMTKYVSPIHQDSEKHIEIDNPNYIAPPEDPMAYLKYIKAQSDKKNKQEEKSKLQIKVVYSVPNDNFRLIQMYFFHEMQCLFRFAEQLESVTTETHDSEDINNVGWIASLLCNQQCYLVVNDIKEKIYYGYILPGNTREMQLSIETPLKQLKPRDILYQISSPIYYEHISPYFKSNIGLLWDDLKNKTPAEVNADSFLWDVRQNIILHFFYFLHLTQKGIHAGVPDVFKRIFLVSIYTLRYEALTLDDKDGYLLGFCRKWYLFQKDHVVSCYQGFHAMENALYAWSCYVYGRDNAFTNLVAMIEEQALPDAHMTMENVVTEGTYASTVMENSIFIK